MTTLTTLQQLLTGPVTGEEGRAFVRDLIATAPQPISKLVLDTPGTPESAIIWGVGEAEAQRSADRLLFARSGFRSTAPREWLAIVAQEVFGLTPREADFATTNVTVTNSSGALYGPFDAGTLRVVNGVTDKVYVNAEEVTIPIGGTVLAGVLAREAGTRSDAQVGEISRLETPLEGVTVTNLQPALGQDAESAESLNGRIDARIGALGVPGASFSTGGPSSAFESIAKNGVDNGGGVPRADGSRIAVTRTRLVFDIFTSELTLYVADDDGPLATGDLTLVESAVQAYAEWLGSAVTVANTTTVAVAVNGALTITGASALDADILAQVAVELTRASRTAPIGGFSPSSAVSLRYVENAVESAGDAGKQTAFTLVDVGLTTPAGATALDPSEVIVLSVGTITITRV